METRIKKGIYYSPEFDKIIEIGAFSENFSHALFNTEGFSEYFSIYFVESIIQNNNYEYVGKL